MTTTTTTRTQAQALIAELSSWRTVRPAEAAARTGCFECGALVPAEQAAGNLVDMGGFTGEALVEVPASLLQMVPASA